jgi:hypothetical protein
MNSVSVSRLCVLFVIAFATGFTASMSDGFGAFVGGDFATLWEATEANFTKALAVGGSSALTAVISFLTVPFSGLPANALEYKNSSKKVVE